MDKLAYSYIVGSCKKKVLHKGLRVDYTTQGKHEFEWKRRQKKEYWAAGRIALKTDQKRLAKDSMKK